MSVFVFDPLPVPRPPADYLLRHRAIELAGRLASLAGRFAAWAKEAGIAWDLLALDDKEDMIHQLDAAVAHLYGLTEKHLVHIFETFHEGWDYDVRLHATLKHFREWQWRRG